jgi:hypothetical protein
MVIAKSQQYCLVGRPFWSLVENFRALALSHAVAMWLLRLCRGGGQPTVEQMIEVVGAIDRGLSYAGFAGFRHRWRLIILGGSGNLQRLLTWYAR